MHTNEIPVCLERVNMVGRITEKRRRACDIFCPFVWSVAL